MTRAKIIFQLFGQLTGLMINLNKSELAITSASLPFIQSLSDVIHCKPQLFPIRYLGLPLSDKRLQASDFQPLIDRFQTALAGWRASLLSIGGRLILTNSVLTAMPLYFMSIFLLPKWVLKKIDQIRRQFLWHGHRDQIGQTKGLYMISWLLTTRPRELGGLGVKDLQIMNHALLLKWMWMWHRQPNAWWKEVTPVASPSNKPWNNPQATTFWKNLRHLAPIFDSSVSYKLGNGENISFWHDNWCGTPLNFLYPSLYQLAQDKHTSVRQSSNTAGWSLHFPLLTPSAQQDRDRLLLHLQTVQTTQSLDEIKWLRNSTTTFSVSSVYRFLTHTPSPSSPFASIWKIKGPLRVIVFSWKLLTNRLPTLDNLSRRGWQLPNMCTMCKANEESIDHLFCKCLVAKEIRNYIYTVFANQHTLPPKFNSPLSTQLIADQQEEKAARQWEITTCFVLWRERCRRIFTDKEIPWLSLVREISLEWHSWFHTTTTLLSIPHDPG